MSAACGPRSAKAAGSAPDVERATEAERRRIAREIHDQLGQMLTALKIDMTRLRKRLASKTRPEALVPEVDSMAALVDATLAAARRIAAELRPRVLDDLGLSAAIEWQARDFESRTGVRTRISIPQEDLGVAEPAATAVYRICQEVLTNIARHAGATVVDVRLSRSGDLLELEVRDNGRGLPPETSRRPASLGLLGMRERAALAGGDIGFDASPGRGTTVTLKIPIHANSNS